jgi:hypothetical protein
LQRDSLHCRRRLRRRPLPHRRRPDPTQKLRHRLHLRLRQGHFPREEFCRARHELEKFSLNDIQKENCPTFVLFIHRNIGNRVPFLDFRVTTVYGAWFTGFARSAGHGRDKKRARPEACRCLLMRPAARRPGGRILIENSIRRQLAGLRKARDRLLNCFCGV